MADGEKFNIPIMVAGGVGVLLAAGFIIMNYTSGTDPLHPTDYNAQPNEIAIQDKYDTNDLSKGRHGGTHERPPAKPFDFAAYQASLTSQPTTGPASRPATAPTSRPTTAPAPLP